MCRLSISVLVSTLLFSTSWAQENAEERLEKRAFEILADLGPPEPTAVFTYDCQSRSGEGQYCRILRASAKTHADICKI